MKSGLLLATVVLLALAACERRPAGQDAVPTPSAPPWASAATPDSAAAPASAPTPIAPATKAANVPERFRGEWNMNVADCGTGLNDSRLVIGPREIRFYETGGPIRLAEQPAPDTLTIVAALSGEAEGPTDATLQFRISADGETLTTLGEGAPLMRHRCPVA